MFNEEFFRKVCSVTCCFEELTSFGSKMNEKEFVLDNPFDKYFSPETVEKAINKYKKQEISDQFLASWMNVYNWIITGGFNNSSIKENIIDLVRIIIWEISNILDALSFFEANEEIVDGNNLTDGIYDLKQYIRTINRFYNMYKNLSTCEVWFYKSIKNPYDNYYFLIKDNANKMYFEIEYEFENGPRYQIVGQEVSKEKLLDLKKQFIADGFEKAE